MSRHIVRSFTSVNERHVFRTDQIHRRFHIDSNVRISVLVNRQTGRSVLNEHLQHANFEITQLRQRINNMPRDQVESARMRGKRNLGLVPAVQRFLESENQ